MKRLLFTTALLAGMTFAGEEKQVASESNTDKMLMAGATTFSAGIIASYAYNFAKTNAALLFSPENRQKLFDYIAYIYHCRITDDMAAKKHIIYGLIKQIKDNAVSKKDYSSEWFTLMTHIRDIDRTHYYITLDGIASCDMNIMKKLDTLNNKTMLGLVAAAIASGFAIVYGARTAGYAWGALKDCWNHIRSTPPTSTNENNQ